MSNELLRELSENLQEQPLGVFPPLQLLSFYMRVVLKPHVLHFLLGLPSEVNLMLLAQVCASFAQEFCFSAQDCWRFFKGNPRDFLHKCCGPIPRKFAQDAAQDSGEAFPKTKAIAHQASQPSYHAIAFTSQPAHHAITFSLLLAPPAIVMLCCVMLCYHYVDSYNYFVTFRPTVLLFQNNRPVNSHVSHRLEQTEPRRSEEEIWKSYIHGLFRQNAM